MKNDQVMIIGGGPAGMITAIQLKRYRIQPILFESKRLGGLLWNANLVENYPGFPGGIPGPELAGRIIEQFESQGLRPIDQYVSQLDYDGTEFLATTKDGVYTARVVVIATGTEPNTLPAPLNSPGLDEHIHYEVADMMDVYRSTVAIIGAGDAAFDYALNLSRRENRVIILNRGDQIKSLPLLVSRADSEPNISYQANTAITSIEPHENGLLIQAVDGDGQKVYKVDKLLAAIGRSATRPDFTDRLKAREVNLIKNARLHFAGDVHNGIYRQTAIAVGDGLRKAMEIYQFHEEQQS